MHKVGQSAYTPHGIGEITEVETVRGRTTYRVAGRGFNVYIEASKLQVASNPAYLAGLETTIDPGRPYHVNEDNSTTLPYDPSPQYPVDIFRHEQTIRPGEFEIDPDDRLRSSDSLTNNKAKDNRPYPGPNPDLFAKSARFDDEDPDYGGPGPEHDPHYEQHSADLAHERTQDEHAAQSGHWPHHAAFEDTDPERPEWGDDEWHEGLPDGPERTFAASLPGVAKRHRRQANDADSYWQIHHSQDGLHDVARSQEEAHAKLQEMRDAWDKGDEMYGGDNPDYYSIIPPRNMLNKDLAKSNAEKATKGWNPDQDPFDPREFGASYRPAGLSNRYAHIMEAEDHTEIGMFRRDPVGYQQRFAHVMIAGEEEQLFQKFADYDNLLDTDPHMREAAWKDVAAKAKRLRAEGAVHPEDIGPNRIMATVDGDNATYKTLVLRGPGYAGIGKGANSASFSCSCQWGKWAFKRQYTFVGRMCSHALATLWELQSHAAKDNPGRFKKTNPRAKRASVVDDFKKWSNDNNDGHMDQGSIEDFLNTADDDLTKEDVEKLYDYLADHHQEAPERDYDIPYTFDNEKAYKTAGPLRRVPSGGAPGKEPSDYDNEDDVLRSGLRPEFADWYVKNHQGEDPVAAHKRYKQADILRTQPQSLTPDLRMVPHNDEHEWTDVTEDDRQTTAPDQIVHFSHIMAALHPRYADDQHGPGWVDPSTFSGGGGTRAPDSGTGSRVTNPLHQFQHWLDPSANAPGPGQGADGYIPRGPNGMPLSPAAPSAGKPAQTTSDTGYHMNTNDLPAGGLGKGSPGAPLSITDYLHPSGAPAAAAGATAPAPPPAAGPAGQLPDAGAPPPPGGPSAPGNPAVPGSNAIGQGTSYHVNAGDTLSDIAERAGLGRDNYQQIADANKDKISDPNHIETGWDLKIPGQGSSSSADTSTVAGGTKPIAPGSPADMNTPETGDDLSTAAGGTKPIALGSPAAPDASSPPVGAPPADPTKNPALTNPALTPPGLPPNHASRRYAEASDANLLDKLRQLSSEPASDDLQHMDSRNDELRDVVEELQDRGVDASFMVASLHYAENPADGDANFLGQSNPNWMDKPFAGSGPDPRSYISDSQSYLDSHEPDLHDVTDLGDDDAITKFNDSRSRPQQGPRHASEGVKRAGGGPQRGVRVDPGVRGAQNALKHAQGTMPETEDMTSIAPPDEPDLMASSGNDLVANFQRSAAAQDLLSSSSSSGGGMYSDDAIAAHAQAMLRTAGRKFTPQEQRELEEEAHHMGARNLPDENDLQGTHYLMGI